MDRDPFDKQIEGFRVKILEILDDSLPGAEPASPDLEAMQASITDMLEELQIASEELRQQNEELYQAQHQIQEESRRYQALFAAAPDAYLVTDHLGIISEANAAAVNLLNLAPNHVPGRPLITFFRGEALQEMLRHLRLVSRERSRREWETQICPRGLTPIDAVISIAVQNDAPGQTLRVLWLIRDVSEHRRMERKLFESRARLSTIFEAASLGIVLFDLTGRLIEYNPAFQKMLGYTAEDLQDMKYTDLLADDGGEKRGLFIDLAAGERDRYDIECTLQNKEEQPVWVRSIMSLLRDERQGAQYILGLFEDITIQHQYVDELIELERHITESVEKEREELARDLHDGPLQHQIGITFQIQQILAMSTDPAVNAELENLKGEVQQVINMLRMTGGLLRSPTLAHFGLDKAIQAYAEQVQASGQRTQIKVEIQHPDWTISSRVQQGIYRIFQHLVANTQRHAGADQVVVRLMRKENHIVLEVEDDGEGFEVPHRWVDLTQAGHYGLVGSAERAAGLGGVLQVRSKPGEGTLIRVVIPLREVEQRKRSLGGLAPEIPRI